MHPREGAINNIKIVLVIQGCDAQGVE